MSLAPNLGLAAQQIDKMTLCGALVASPFLKVANQLDTRLTGTEPWKIVVGTVGVSLGVAYLYSLTRHRIPLRVRVKAYMFKWIKRIPAVRRKIMDEKSKMKANMTEELQRDCMDLPDILVLPANGFSHDDVIQKANEYLEYGNMDWESGALSGGVYNGSKELSALIKEVYGLALWANPLHPDAFPGLRQMEMEVVRMTCDMFQGGPESCGCVTTGGTESILLACKAYRDRALERGIEFPEILVPVSAHAAFDKAAQILGMNIQHAPMDPITMRVDLPAMKRLITKNTAMLVGSAPQFPHGSIDPIEEIGQLGLKYDIPVHVDACLGGFIIAFQAEAGYPVGGFDFSVPGVCSISADTHKYGYAPKGSSVLVYKYPELRNYQWFACPDWPGGIYATPTIGGSRAGGIIAATWASMIHFGRSGYVESTKSIVETTRRVAKELADIPGLKIVGVPEVSVVGFGSDHFNVYSVTDGMKNRGWSLNSLQFPVSAHICITTLHTLPGVADRFLNDVREITAEIMKNPGACDTGTAAVYGMAASIPDRSIVSELTGCYLDALYSSKLDLNIPAKNV